MKRLRIALLAATTATAVAACGSADGVGVEGQWARTSPAMADAGAVYMQLTAEEADRLIGASVASDIAARVEVHETTAAHMDGEGESMEGEGSMEGEEPMEGMGPMMMQEVEAIDLPAGETVNLEPGGFHIMLLELSTPLELGRTFDLTLRFAEAGEQTVTVEVRDEAP